MALSVCLPVWLSLSLTLSGLKEPLQIRGFYMTIFDLQTTESEKFTVTLNNAQLPFNSSYVKHLIETQLYADAAGVMKVAFAVDLADSNALVWRNAPGGLYTDKPDPALVLPARYNRREIGRAHV